jgi:two-component system cell cycle sensor histidine kinase/response regulator CckA
MEITAQVRAEAALKTSEARMRALLEGLPDIVFLLDREGVVLDLHAPDAIPLLRPREELLGQPFTASMPPDIAKATTAALASVRETRHPGSIHCELALPNGVRQFEATFTVSEDDHFTVLVHDATTRASLEEQLRQAQKMEAVGQLTGGIAHDFNNLLTVIGGNAELLADGAVDTGRPAPPEVQEIVRATRRGAAMVSQLLQFSRRGVLRRQLVDPAVVITRMTTMLARLLPESVQLMVGELQPGCTLSLDTGALDQIVTNLCTNARDAMPDGGTIWIESRETADGHYRISVRDAGVGMNAETQSHLFEPFFTTKPFGAGTGLGLSMVYGLMKSHGGYVDVQSAPGEGTDVRLYFPIVPGPSASELHEVPGDARDVIGGRESILVVEDDPAIRMATRRALESKGYRVWDAADGAIAIDVFRAHAAEIALVISDLVMPNLGGRQLAEAIRAAGSRVPILFTSGYSSDWLYGESGVPEQVLFLPKPWTLVDLYRTVREALTGTAAAPPSDPRAEHHDAR